MPTEQRTRPQRGANDPWTWLTNHLAASTHIPTPALPVSTGISPTRPPTRLPTGPPTEKRPSNRHGGPGHRSPSLSRATHAAHGSGSRTSSHQASHRGSGGLHLHRCPRRPFLQPYTHRKAVNRHRRPGHRASRRPSTARIRPMDVARETPRRGHSDPGSGVPRTRTGQSEGGFRFRDLRGRSCGRGGPVARRRLSGVPVSGVRVRSLGAAVSGQFWKGKSYDQVV